VYVHATRVNVSDLEYTVGCWFPSSSWMMFNIYFVQQISEFIYTVIFVAFIYCSDLMDVTLLHKSVLIQQIKFPVNCSHNVVWFSSTVWITVVITVDTEPVMNSVYL